MEGLLLRSVTVSGSMSLVRNVIQSSLISVLDWRFSSDSVISESQLSIKQKLQAVGETITGTACCHFFSDGLMDTV